MKKLFYFFLILFINFLYDIHTSEAASPFPKEDIHVSSALFTGPSKRDQGTKRKFEELQPPKTILQDITNTSSALSVAVSEDNLSEDDCRPLKKSRKDGDALFKDDDYDAECGKELEDSSDDENIVIHTSLRKKKLSPPTDEDIQKQKRVRDEDPLKNPLIKTTIELLNESMFMDLGKDPQKWISLLPQNTYEYYVKLGGNEGNLLGHLINLKKANPKVIKDPKYRSVRITPGYRLVLPRHMMRTLKTKGEIQSLTDQAYVEPEIILTEDERKAIKAETLKKFKEMEKASGKTEQDLKDERDFEPKTWANYFSYLDSLKSEVASKKREKLTKLHLQEAFAASIKEHYDGYLKVDNYHVSYSTKTLDLSRKDSLSRTNLERMREGMCPIGPDGASMNLHHLTRYDAYTHKVSCEIIYLSETFHRTMHGPLHPADSVYRSPSKRVNRLLFAQARSEINMAIAAAHDK